MNFIRDFENDCGEPFIGFLLGIFWGSLGDFFWGSFGDLLGIFWGSLFLWRVENKKLIDFFLIIIVLYYSDGF